MFAPMWPALAEIDRPVAAVTNGVHAPTWIAADLRDLFTRYLGADWIDRHDDPALWDGVLAIPDEELWADGSRSGGICSRSPASARASAGSKSRSASRASSPPARCSSPKR